MTNLLMAAARPETYVTPPTDPPIRILVAEDHPLMLEAIVSRLSAAEDIEVIGTVEDGRTLVDRYVAERPDLVLTDCNMPGTGGIEAAAEIRKIDPDAKVLILSAFDDQSLLGEAVAAGAIGFVVKSIPGSDLCQSVRDAAAGTPVFDAETTKLLMAELRSPKKRLGDPTPLSQREIEILKLVAEGMTNGQIAKELYISAQTVKTHMERIFTKLSVRGRAAAVREGIALDLI